ncbi:aromatic amino acid transport family protein [Endozoicomonas arenosclerae]|uniref:aromatic amino acid transport family protein n=1 Tax=Endozoicomonas arenosclerae TaxID=1633495 RepID=UPI000781E0E9|nr:aromatic amino acid transport family protein [Endozoicomonas arenosclerae]
MAEHNQSRCLGSVFILSGTAVGAGMLALPLVSAQLGFWVMLGLLATNFLVVVLAALITLEANLQIDPGCSLYSMAARVLGRWGKVLAVISPLLLFYSLMAAYLAGGGSLVYQYLGDSVAFGPQFSVIVFTVFAGAFVYFSTRSVDLLSRLLFTLMMLAFIAALLTLFPEVSHQNLTYESVQWWPAIIAIPVIFTSFGFHGSIPSIILYLKSDTRRVGAVFVLGALVPLLVYIFWLYVATGVLSQQSLIQLTESGESAGGLVRELTNAVGGSQLKLFLHVFSDLALLTSFLGVSLGLFDYLASLLQRDNSWLGRLQTASVTFIPPVIFALCYPEGFILALGYASVALAILAILLPVLIVTKIRKDKKYPTGSYRAPGGKPGLILCFFFGCLVIFAQFMISLGFFT